MPMELRASGKRITDSWLEHHAARLLVSTCVVSDGYLHAGAVPPPPEHKAAAGATPPPPGHKATATPPPPHHEAGGVPPPPTAQKGAAAPPPAHKGARQRICAACVTPRPSYTMQHEDSSKMPACTVAGVVLPDGSPCSTLRTKDD